ncbi:MAG TPA: CDP-alcohol phosphatidyltransferase family protein [Capillimicrobium sp.]
MSTRTSRPSIAELRAVGQPPSIFERNSGEHWAGRLYVRRMSPYLTRALLRTPVTPNGVTWLMIGAGLAAAAVLTLPGIWATVGAVLLVQAQILFDCSDGELARWLDRKSPVGVYLDRLGHYLTEAALPIALGVRADGGWDSLGGYTTLGLLIAVLVLLVKAETVLVTVARVEAGLPKAEDTVAVAAPRGLLGRLRRFAGHLPFFRAFVAMEATFLALAAAVGDALTDSLDVTRGLVIALVPIAVVTLLGHLAAILASRRLRA